MESLAKTSKGLLYSPGIYKGVWTGYLLVTKGGEIHEVDTFNRSTLFCSFIVRTNGVGYIVDTE
jgi:hypothetical protein